MTVVLVPVPAMKPGLIVQVPVAGRPLNTTVPVGDAHEDGCVIAPTKGIVDVPGASFMTTLPEGAEVQPAESATVKLYVPGLRPEIVVVVPVPVIDPGLIVQVPEAGKPFKTTLPVGAAQERGWVIVPGDGAEGIPFTVSVTTFDVALLAPPQLVRYARY